MAEAKGNWSSTEDSSSSSSESSGEEAVDVDDASRPTRRGVTERDLRWRTGYTITGIPYIKANIKKPQSLLEWGGVANNIEPAMKPYRSNYDLPKNVPKKNEEEPIMPDFYSDWEFVLVGAAANEQERLKSQKSQPPEKHVKQRRSESAKQSQGSEHTEDNAKLGRLKRSEDQAKKSHSKVSKNRTRSAAVEDANECIASTSKKLEPSASGNPVLRPVDGLNPLLIDHVVERILGELPTLTVKACRLLCRQWNTASTEFLLKMRKSLLIRSNPYNEADVLALQKSLKEDKGFGLDSLTVIGFKFLTFENPIGTLLTDVAKNLRVLKLSSCLVNPFHLGELLNDQAKYLEVLHFHSIGFDTSLDRVINLSWTIMLENLHLPHLKDFKLIDEHKVDYEGVSLFEPAHGSIRIPMYRMSIAFPNLERLTCKTDIAFDMKEEPNLKRYLNKKHYRKCNWNSTLKEVAIHRLDFGMKTVETASIFRALETTGVRNLTKVDITPFLDGEEPRSGFRLVMDDIWNFLNEIKDTVKEVRVAVYCENCPSYDLPMMPITFKSLERLCMSSDMIVSLTTLPRISSFRRLEIEDHHSVGGIKKLLMRKPKSDRFGASLRGEVWVNPLIESLRLHTRGWQDIAGFKIYCPHIRELDLNLAFHDYKYFVAEADKLNYDLLSQAFPHLEKLKIRFPVNYDSGMDPRDKDIIGDTGLSRMEKLRVVDMHPARRLTDAAVYAGFRQMKDLEYLNLSRTQVTNAALEWIGADPSRYEKLKVLKVEGCPRIDAEHCVQLSSLRQDLHVIYDPVDKEIEWCSRTNKESRHNREICNCEGAGIHRMRRFNYENSCHGAGARPRGSGFW